MEMPRPYTVPIVSVFVDTLLKSGAFVLSTSRSNRFTSLSEINELLEPVSNMVTGQTRNLLVLGAIILDLIVTISLADFRLTTLISAGENVHELSLTNKGSWCFKIKLEVCIAETTLRIGNITSLTISPTLFHIFSRVFTDSSPFKLLSITSFDILQIVLI